MEEEINRERNERDNRRRKREVEESNNEIYKEMISIC